jgi:Zinc-ribbon containing domain
MPTNQTGDNRAEDSLAALYERCREEIQRLLDHTTILTAESCRVVAQMVQEQFAKTGGVNQDELQRVIDTLLQHWQEMLARRAQGRQDVHPPAAIQVLTEQGVSWLAHLAGAVKTLAGEVESHLQRELEYHTGTVVGAGNFFCVRCDKEIQKEKTGPLPPCSHCHGTIFYRRR